VSKLQALLPLPKEESQNASASPVHLLHAVRATASTQRTWRGRRWWSVASDGSGYRVSIRGSHETHWLRLAGEAGRYLMSRPCSRACSNAVRRIGPTPD